MDEQTSEADRFFQRSTAVLPQVQDESMDVFGFQFADELRHIGRGANGSGTLVPFVAAVKGREVNDA